MQFACRITKATNTYSEYVIITAFPRKQYLHERAQYYVARKSPVLFSIREAVKKLKYMSLCIKIQRM
jgi:hypothetical protein